MVNALDLNATQKLKWVFVPTKAESKKKPINDVMGFLVAQQTNDYLMVNQSLALVLAFSMSLDDRFRAS